MLAIIRSIFLLIAFLFVNVLLTLACFCRPFHRDNVYLAGKLYGSLSRIVGLKVTLRVPESLNSGGPYVYICNHQNSYDLITVCVACLKGTVTVGKKSLIWIPVFGWVYWLTGNILIDRQNKGSARDTLSATVEKIKASKLSVWFFPEGTRSYGRGLLPFKTGAFRIAQATKEQVVVVAASELHDKIKLNRWDNGTLIIELSQPYDVDPDDSPKVVAELFHSRMQQKIDKLNHEVEQLKS